MKLVHGEREYNLTWRDGCWLAGALLFIGGLSVSFGWGIVVAAVGAAVFMAPLVVVEKPEPVTEEKSE